VYVQSPPESLTPTTTCGKAAFNRPINSMERGASVTDGMWIIVLGETGLIGLFALGLALGTSALALIRRVPVHGWSRPAAAPAVALTVATLIWAIDNLLNGMMSPVFPAMMGAVASFTAVVRRTRTWAPVATRARERPAIVAAQARSHAS